MPDKALIIVPTYNERENIERLIERALFQDARLEILVVDDGSPDGTGAVVQGIAAVNSRVHLLPRASKLGLGTAYLAGFRWALERDYALILEMDADFSHDPKYLAGLLTKIEQADLVLGSRYATGVNVINWPMSRLLLSWFANKYVRWITGLPLTDATGGFKCFRREVLEAIPLDRVRSDGYAFQIEMSFRAWKKGFRLAELPIVFVDRIEGHSKMNQSIVREAVWMVWWLRVLSIFGRLG